MRWAVELCSEYRHLAIIRKPEVVTPCRNETPGGDTDSSIMSHRPAFVIPPTSVHTTRTMPYQVHIHKRVLADTA